MVCYDKARIYGIYDEDGVCVYVGSTCQTISKRKAEHRRDYNKTPERPIYKYVKEHGGWECFDFRLIEEISCLNKEQLLRAEGQFIRELKPVGNKCVAGRTKKEYLQDHRVEWNEYLRQYRHENREKLNEKKRNQYRLRKKEEKEISSTSSSGSE